MDNWKIHLVVVTFCALVQTQRGLSSTAEERVPSKDSQRESMDTFLNNQLEGLMKRSKALRFYGLMGKRSVTRKPFQVNRRNKGEVFVGLMGRSISNRESLTRFIPSATTAATHAPEKPSEREGPQEWIRILY
ncbi:uncharacterized protein si:ch211-131k2.2 [Cololabis saira]|uniref:uncharacterized protein si:ch211-131k2.2 n=1 Tax=Cololabis saira TaxID=129043 RepID=UPI002AD23700|nr:uncharacterized protein si:ch211-131k2.2 [Cololabis saira]